MPVFVTFEGVEGSGKSTQMALAAKWLEGQGLSVLTTRQPGGCPLGLELRRILLDAANTDVHPVAELFMYLADRAQHVAQVIQPALNQGRIVLCDRYHDSTVAYQGFGRGLEVASLLDLGRVACLGLAPDATLLLDLPAAQGLARARGRNLENGTHDSEGRFEALELDFHERVRQGYLTLARREPERYAVIEAGADPQTVADRVGQALAARLRRANP